MNGTTSGGFVNDELHGTLDRTVQRLLSILAWADCQEASFLVAAGDLKGAAGRLVDATAKLEAVARLKRGERRTFWRPVVSRFQAR